MHREILNSAQNKLLKLLPSFSSDIDIVVEFESDKKNIHNFLAEREEDLGIKSNIKPLIKEKVKSQIIYMSLEDILDSINAINSYTKNITY